MVVAAIIGSAVAPMFSDWNGPAAVFEGAVCGAIMALVIGFVMSWHGGAIGGSPGRCATAALWGIITGAVLGLSLGPPLGAAVGIFFGHIVGGAFIGFAGPLVGIAAWELAFSSDEIIEAIRRRRAQRQSG